MKNVPHAKAFDFSKKSKVKKRVRRQFVVDGQVGFFRGTMDECLPTPWFIENPQEKKETLASPIVYKQPTIFDENDTRKNTALPSFASLKSSPSHSPIRKTKAISFKSNSIHVPTDWYDCSIQNDDTTTNNNKYNNFSSTSPSYNNSPNISKIYNKLIKKNIPSYSIAGKYQKDHNHNNSPGPAYYPVTPSKYHRHMHKSAATVFGSTKRSIIEQPIDPEKWMKRWRPKIVKWKTIDPISNNTTTISRNQPPLTLPQLRRFNLGSKDDLNSSLGGTFNSYLRPSTKRTSKIVKNEAYIVEARKNIWKSLRYQERMHLPGVVMERLKYSKVKLSDKQRKIRKITDQKKSKLRR